MKISTIALVLFTATISSLSFANCSWNEPNDLLINSLDEINGTLRPLSLEELQSDLDCLKNIFQKQYIAEHIYNNENVFLLDQVRNFSTSLISPINQEKFMNGIIGIHDNAYDAHVGYSFTTKDQSQIIKRLPHFKLYSTKGKFQKVGNFYEDLTDASIQISSCDNFSPYLALKEDGITEIYSFITQNNTTSPDKAKCITSDNKFLELPVEEIPLNKLEQEHKQFHFKIIENNILYVRIPQFTPGISPDQKKLVDYLKDENHVHPIIFDLRQNGGGDDTFAYELSKTLRSNTDRLPSLNFYDKDSLHSTASFVNAFFIQWKILESNNSPNADTYKELYNEYLSIFKNQVKDGWTLDYLNIRKQTEFGQSGTRSQKYPPKIILLYDKMCASACESMMGVFSGMDNVIKIGTHSAGLLHFGNMGISVLPNSKIAVITGWRAFEYPELVPEGLGYKPDYYSANNDLLNTAINYLKFNQRGIL